MWMVFAPRSDMLQVGDILVSVNGIKTSSMKHEEIINLLKNADSNVRLEIEYELPDLCKPCTIKFFYMSTVRNLYAFLTSQ